MNAHITLMVPAWCVLGVSICGVSGTLQTQRHLSFGSGEEGDDKNASIVNGRRWKSRGRRTRTYVLQGHLSNGERSDMAHVYILCGSHNRQGSLWTTELWEYAVREVCQPVEAGKNDMVQSLRMAARF